MAFSANGSLSVSSEINITPLIDVLLVLLIIFMVIVPVTQPGLGTELPQSPPAHLATQQPLSVRLTATAASGAPIYTVEGRVIAAEGLGAALRSALAVRPERGVFVSASPEVSYRAVAQAVSAAKLAGATAVALGR